MSDCCPQHVGVRGAWFKDDGLWQHCFIWTDSLSPPLVGLSGVDGFHVETLFSRAATLFTRNGIQIALYGKGKPLANWGISFNIIQRNATKFEPLNWNGKGLADLESLSPSDLRLCS